MKKIIFTTSFLCCLLVGEVFGQTNQKPEGKYCSTQVGRFEYVEKFTSDYYNWLTKKIERVPPDVEKYLTSEYEDSINIRNESRLKTVMENQYYYPWKLRKSIQNLTEESISGYGKVSGWGFNKKNSHENEILFYTNLLGKNFEISEKFDEYQRFDEKRKKPYLKPYEDSFTFTLYKGTYLIVIQDLIRCSFQKSQT
jgi:hypothetical protein